MIKRPWTKSELDLLAGPLPDAEIARQIGRTLVAVQNKRLRVKADPGAAGGPLISVVEERDLERDKAAHDDNYWRDQHAAVTKLYNRAVKESVLVDRLVADIKELAPTSYSAAPEIRRVRAPGMSSPQSAVLLLSDTHIGKVVVPEQTLGFGEYNFSTFLARLKYVEESVISILEDHVNTPVPELVVAMIGDMLDGALNHGVEGGLRNTIFTQFYAGGHAIAQFLRNIAAHIPKVRVETVNGNHSRFQNQHRMPSENRFSNFDMLLYALVEALTKDIPNIKWNLNQQPFQIFEVQGFTFYAAHGDHWKGGDKALGIPNHAVGRAISSTGQLFGKHGVQSPHYYLSGHLHRSITLPHAIGEVLINGGFPGLDNYGLQGGFNPVDPTQRFFLVHPRFGKTASYNLSLKFAEVGEPPYDIPGNFPVE